VSVKIVDSRQGDATVKLLLIPRVLQHCTLYLQSRPVRLSSRIWNQIKKSEKWKTWQK